MWFQTNGDQSRSEADRTILLDEIIGSGEFKAGNFSWNQRRMYWYSIPQSNITCVCAKAMKNILGVSAKKWNNVKNFQNCPEERSTLTRSHFAVKEESVYRFLLTTKSVFAEHLPNDPNFDLPSNFTIEEIKRMYDVQNPAVRVSTQYFLKIWEVFSCT